MSSTFLLNVVTPYRNFYSDDVEMVIIKAPDGERGILKGHIPMVVAVDVGPIKILKDGKWQVAFVSEGFMEIKQDETIMLVDTAEWPEEIDVRRAEAARQRALERLQKKISKVEYVRTQSALTRALSRLKVSRKPINHE